MGHTEYLESIIEEAQALLLYATSGGKLEHAANLHMSLNDLHDMFNKLFEVNSNIREEIGE